MGTLWLTPTTLLRLYIICARHIPLLHDRSLVDGSATRREQRAIIERGTKE